MIRALALAALVASTSLASAADDDPVAAQAKAEVQAAGLAVGHVSDIVTFLLRDREKKDADLKWVLDNWVPKAPPPKTE